MFAIVAMLVAGGAAAQSEDVDADIDFEIISTEALIDDDGLAQLTDAEFTGNPMQSLVANWPEDLVIAPIPGYSPELGWKLTLAGGYFLDASDEDGNDKPSILGGFGMYTENDSYAYGAGGYLHLLDDRLRVKFGAAYVDVNYRFFGIGNDAGDLGFSLDIQQEIPAYFVSATYRIFSKVYAGLGYIEGSVDTRLRLPALPPLPPEFPPLPPNISLSRKLDIAAWQIPLQFDTRDHEQFPREGWLVNANTMLYRESIGGSFDAETFQMDVNRYLPMRDADVLAFRGYVRATDGTAPFFVLSTFGGRTDLRGYDIGRYRDRMMYAVQGEYRWQVRDKWILTGFAGVGEVADNFGDFGDNFLPAAGVGARFVLSQKHRVSLAADVARGKNGWQFYFGVGEAF